MQAVTGSVPLQVGAIAPNNSVAVAGTAAVASAICEMQNVTRKNGDDDSAKTKGRNGKGGGGVRIPRRPQKNLPIINPMSAPPAINIPVSASLLAPGVVPAQDLQQHTQDFPQHSQDFQHQRFQPAADAALGQIHGLQGHVPVPNIIGTMGQSSLPGAHMQGAATQQIPMTVQEPVMGQGSLVSSQVAYPGQAMQSQPNVPLQPPVSTQIPLQTLGSLAASINLPSITAGLPLSFPPSTSSVPSSGLNVTAGLTPQLSVPLTIPPPSGLQLDLTHLPPQMRTSAVEYDVFVSELSFNSKEIINNLTRVAHENIASSPAIATVVVQRILTSPPDRKLPLLYLMDSISKNVGEPYVSNFTSSAPRVFLNAYRSAGQSVRASMQRLLNTWIMVFGTTVVDSIRRDCIPLDASPVSTVHINPAISPVVPGSAALPISTTIPTSLSFQAGSTGVDSTVPFAPALRGAVNRSPVVTEMNQVVASITSTVLKGGSPGPEELARLSELITTQLQTAGPDDRQRLLALQAQVAALSSSAKTAASVAPSLTYPASWKDIKGDGYRLVVKGLYDDLEHVSKTDGMRFNNLEDLRSHMDWLFKQNRRKRARKAGSVSQCWYDSFDKFLNPEASTFGNTNESGATGDSESDELKAAIEKMEEPRVPASGEADEKCPVCFEKFESIWDDEKQSWMLREAKQVEGVTYHAKCAPGSTPRLLVKRRRDGEDEQVEDPGSDKKKTKTLTLQEAVQ